MERREAIARLPIAYQRVLVWLDQGWSGDRIAKRLGIDPLAVGPLIALAEAKLARLLGEGSSGDPEGEGGG